ncbi:hypothetical protein JCM3770_005873 [Rhodotorula araucariae]
MRQKRTKGARKVMQLYCSAFGFREPYQLLMDAAFIESAVKQKFDLESRLHDVLQGLVKPMITQCCMQALYDLGADAQDVIDVAKGFERRKCNHLKPRPEEECLAAMAGESNRNRYVYATQSLALRQTLRRIPGSPIIYIARSVLLLEAPSDQTLAKKRQMETAKLHVSAAELALITGQPAPSEASTSAAPTAAATTGEGGDEPPAAKKPRKPKGPKGPNPLSVRKKKPSAAAVAAARQDGGRPPKRARDEGPGGAGEVASMPTRGDGEARKKRKRRRKGAAGAGADGEGAQSGADGGASGEE